MTEKCRTCKYLNGRGTGRLTCGYLMMTGQRRGCPHDETCNKYEPRKKVKEE